MIKNRDVCTSNTNIHISIIDTSMLITDICISIKISVILKITDIYIDQKRYLYLKCRYLH